jgi:hypothetical protein
VKKFLLAVVAIAGLACSAEAGPYGPKWQPASGSYVWVARPYPYGWSWEPSGAPVIQSYPPDQRSSQPPVVMSPPQVQYYYDPNCPSGT